MSVTEQRERIMTSPVPYVKQIEQLEARVRELEEVLRGILEIGKRDLSNPKYDVYFERAQAVLEGRDADV